MSNKKRLTINPETIIGLSIIVIASIMSYKMSHIPAIKAYNLAQTLIAILLGILLGNILGHKTPAYIREVCGKYGKTFLRAGIVLYGFKIQLQQIMSLSPLNYLMVMIIVVSTFLFCYYIGIKILKMDKEEVILIGSGASVCGAAAVIACEASINAKNKNTITALATVVLFGTITIFLYPLLWNILQYNLSPDQFAIFTGLSVHEVGQVVAISDQLFNTEQSALAIITKMIRVSSLVIILVIANFLNKATTKKGDHIKEKTKIKFSQVLPPFVIAFFAMIIVNYFMSISITNTDVLKNININLVMIDDFLLNAGMFSLGFNTTIASIKNMGLKPFILSTILLIWLIVVGLLLVMTLA